LQHWMCSMQNVIQVNRTSALKPRSRCKRRGWRSRRSPCLNCSHPQRPSLYHPVEPHANTHHHVNCHTTVNVQQTHISVCNGATPKISATSLKPCVGAGYTTSPKLMPIQPCVGAFNTTSTKVMPMEPCAVPTSARVMRTLVQTPTHQQW